MTCGDLATAGWRVFPSDPASSRAVVHGDTVPIHRITGVLTRLPVVTERELPMIAAEDRTYAAAEMTAFLGYWLTSLPCPVLNRPTASALCAPGWRTERWVLAANQLGIPTQRRQRHVPVFGSDPAPAADAGPGGPAPDELSTVTVVGERCIGSQDAELVRQARALAGEAGVELLSVLFRRTDSGWSFVDAHPWADVFQEEIGTAILDYFTAGAIR
jgi:hypothetical protein